MNVMAAASSGKEVETEPVLEGPMWKETVTSEQGETLEEENKLAPREGTKEHMMTIERHLDELTFCGSAINDLELQLSSARATFSRTLEECKVQLEETRKRLGACIAKSEPFIEVWRRARQVQEESNKAAAGFDKASSQYAAAKEMIRVTESELTNSLAQSSSGEQTPDDSVNHALLEVLNHATTKVAETEREKRESEMEHRRVLDRCNAVLEEYRFIERKLRPHIIKSRPYYEERWRSGQRLSELKANIAALDTRLRSTKQRYADTLQHLDQLNHSLHRQRRANSLTPDPHLPPPRATDHGNLRLSPPGIRTDHSDSESVQSWQVGDEIPFTGSTGSLPSIGCSSVSDDETTAENTERQPTENSAVRVPIINVIQEGSVTELARELVHHSISSALARFQQS